MSLSTTTNRTDHTENGVTTVFPFHFKIFDEADLVVLSVDQTTGVETTLTLHTDYTVGGVGNPEGSITKVAGVSGDTLIIKRIVAMNQPTKFGNTGRFLPEVHEKAFDRIVMQNQQQQEELDRAVKFSPTSTSRGTMPEPVPGYAVGFDANGDLAAVPNTGVAQTNAWTAADNLIRSDLAATTGAGLVGTDPSRVYPANTVGAWIAGVLGAASSLALPPTIYAVVGREVSVYFDNLIQGDARDFYWGVTCGAGVQYEDRWALVAVAAGTYTLTITAYLKGTEIPLATATADLIVKAASAGTAVNRKVLVIGDSTTAGGQTVSELVTIFSTDAMALTLIGTKGVGPAFHEGISGSTVHAMMTDVASPFAVAGVFNFANYMTVNGYSGLNYVLINLGINDVIVKFTDADLNAQLTSSMADLETMITGIHAYDANIKIGIVIPFPPSSSQDAFGVNYACGYKRWRFKRNIVAWARKVNTQFAGRTVTNKVFIVPGGVGYDTAYNCETTTGGTLVNSRSSIKIAMQGNAVHPDVPGYKQIADGYHAFLKGQE